MNVLRLKTWSERQQVLAIILMAGTVILVLSFFCLMPLIRRRDGIEIDIKRLRSELARKNLLQPEPVLKRTKHQEDLYYGALHREWLSVASRLAALDAGQDGARLPVGHIDYKVTLYEVRQRLRKKARALNVRLPDDLGMDAAVSSTEDSRKLMLQLRTVERLADLALDLKISMVRRIDPLPPLLHSAVNTDAPFLEEYPVRVEFYGTLQNLYDFFHALLQPEQVFALRRLKVEAASRKDAELLCVNAVMSSILFLKDPKDLVPKTVRTFRPAGPMGH